MNGSGAIVDSPQSHGQPQLSAQLIKDSSRIDVDLLMNEFRQELGPEKWESYRDSLTHFLMGKLSRAELVRCLRENLGLSGQSMRNHNTLVLSLLANACREAPPGTESSLSDWKANTRSKTKHAGMDQNNDMLHKEVLSLPVRERRRIKNIAKETVSYVKNPIFPLPQPSVIASRKVMLPKVPFVPDAQAYRDRSKDSSQGNGSSENAGSSAEAGNSTAANTASTQSPITARSKDGKDKDGGMNQSNPLLDPLLSLHPGRTSGPLTWAQDIVQGLDAPLISETHELPDESALCTRMLSVALENGVLGGIGPGTTDMMLLGLESYFRSVIDDLFALKHRKVTSDEPVDASDLNLLAETRPNELGGISAPLLRLRTYYLQDEETLEPPEEERKRKNPWDIRLQGEKRAKVDEDTQNLEDAALDEHNKGIALVDQLL